MSICVKCISNNESSVSIFKLFTWLNSVFQIPCFVLCLNSWIYSCKGGEKVNTANNINNGVKRFHLPRAISQSIDILNGNNNENNYGNTYGNTNGNKINFNDFNRRDVVFSEEYLANVSQSELNELKDYKNYKNRQFELNIIKSKKILEKIKK